MRGLLASAALALLVAACSGGNPYMRAQGARFSRVPDVEPSEVEGKKPVIVLEGEATYYSDSFAGRATTSGEPYDPARRTAASRDLPFGSIVRVTRRDNSAHVLVRVNDRGPFGNHKRILDLSRAAAADLGILQRGVAPVRAEVLVLGKDPGPKLRRHRR
jgi:rare lipoprotein A (peptidoglycan hydrolase)